MNTCVICGSETSNRKLCSNPECKSEHSRRTINRSFAKHGGEITRFRKTNGMSDPEVRARVSTKLRAMAWKPVMQGGNGHGPTIHEQALASALGWDTNVIVNTNMKNGDGYPHHYKVDVGNRQLMIAVEIDGFSHRAMERKSQDRKKEELLRSLGWRVLRFSNAEIESDLQRCVQTVLSII